VRTRKPKQKSKGEGLRRPKGGCGHRNNQGRRIRDDQSRKKESDVRGKKEGKDKNNLSLRKACRGFLLQVGGKKCPGAMMWPCEGGGRCALKKTTTALPFVDQLFFSEAEKTMLEAK